MLNEVGVLKRKELLIFAESVETMPMDEAEITRAVLRIDGELSHIRDVSLEKCDDKITVLQSTVASNFTEIEVLKTKFNNYVKEDEGKQNKRWELIAGIVVGTALALLSRIDWSHLFH